MTNVPRPAARRDAPRLRRALLAAMLALIALTAVPGPGAAAPRGAPWEVFALRYGTLRDFPVHELVAGADTTRKLDIAMMFWLLEGPGGRLVLVDSGFYRQKFIDDWHPADYESPADVVKRFGISPGAITDIIISHVHWDHLDGADLFPHARIWIQRAEYEHHVGANGAPLDAAIDSVDAMMLATMRQAGRVNLVEGDGQEIIPGITVYTGGKHTFASQYAGVRTAKGTVIVASDNVYLYENLDRHVPIAATLDAKSNLAAQDRMRKLAASLQLIVPGHDPAVFTRFHGDRPGMVKIQ